MSDAEQWFPSASDQEDMMRRQADADAAFEAEAISVHAEAQGRTDGRREERARIRSALLAAFQSKKTQPTPTDRYYLSENDFRNILDAVCQEES